MLGLGTSTSSANEIPSLTWERGKTLNVVLGGNSDNLDWSISLAGENASIDFSSSSPSETGFIVYSVVLPRNLSLGQYEIVAKSDDGAVTRVAAVQVVERFQYNVLEIPRDFLFVILALVIFVSIQLTLRSWLRRESDSLIMGQSLKTAGELTTARSELVVALLNQRLRWKSRWLGPDFIPAEFKESNEVVRSSLPVIALVSGLYCGVTANLIPLDSTGGIALLALITVIGVIDRYSAKLVSIGFVSVYVFFNATLNFPSLLSIAFLVFMCFLPQYVGDVVREFLVRESKSLLRRRELREGIAALAAGASIFWLYLLGESLRLGDGTNASKVTPVAIAAALAYLVRAGLLSSRSTIHVDIPTVDGVVLPVISLRSALVTLALVSSVVFVWTEEISLAIVAGLAIGGSLISINLFTKKTFHIKSSLLARAGVQVCFVALSESALVFFVSRLPEVVIDQAKLLLLLVGAPLVLLAVIRLLTTLPNHWIEARGLHKTESHLDAGPSK